MIYRDPLNRLKFIIEPRVDIQGWGKTAYPFYSMRNGTDLSLRPPLDWVKVIALTLSSEEELSLFLIRFGEYISEER